MRLLAATALMTLMSTTAIAQTTPAPAAASANTTLPASNPFAQASTLPLQAPPFDRIKSTDYAPALLAGMAQQRAEINAITRARSAPTFENTIAAMERSGRLLERASMAFYGVVGANTDDTLQKTQADLAPKFAAHQDAINLDPALFARVKTLYDQRQSLRLDPEQLQVLTLTYEGMVRAGAQLSAADKQTLSQYNSQLSTLETAFQQKLLAAAKAGALVVDDKAKLAGLSDAEIAAAADAAKARGMAGKYVLTLQNTTQQPELATMKDRATREALFNAGPVPAAATPTTRATRSRRSRCSARRRRSCSASRPGPTTSSRTRWRRTRRPRSASCSSSEPRSPPNSAARPPSSRRRSRRPAATSS